MRRWTGRASFRFKPALSYSRRRLDLLDRIEETLDPAAFLDVPEEVGVEVLRGARIRIDRDGLALENHGARSDGYESLLPVLGIFFETIEPDDLTFELLATSWTIPIEEVEYDEACGTLARHFPGVAPLPRSGLIPADGAALVDFFSDEYGLQAEYGVVTPSELRDRLENREMGRVKGRPISSAPDSEFEQLSNVLLFVDTLVHTAPIPTLTSPEELMAALAAVDAIGQELVETISSSAFKKETAS